MARTSYLSRNPMPIVKTRWVKAGLDVNMVRKNWRGINETPIKRAGLLIRKVMRGSIRRAHVSKKGDTYGMVSKKPSKPGKPPKARTGVGGKTPPFKYIISEPEYAPGKGIIGHVRLPAKQLQSPPVTPMQAHEFGETVRVKSLRRGRDTGDQRRAKSAKQRRAARKKYLQGEIKQKKIPRVTRQVKMPKRPFAFPALEKVRSRLSVFWKGVINSGTVRK